MAVLAPGAKYADREFDVVIRQPMQSGLVKRL
jgi:hypothetical protein